LGAIGTFPLSNDAGELVIQFQGPFCTSRHKATFTMSRLPQLSMMNPTSNTSMPFFNVRQLGYREVQANFVVKCSPDAPPEMELLLLPNRT
jgi:hypothetical protein